MAVAAELLILISECLLKALGRKSMPSFVPHHVQKLCKSLHQLPMAPIPVVIIDFFQEMAVHKVVPQRRAIAETLESRIHITRISQIRKSLHAMHGIVINLLEV